MSGNLISDKETTRRAVETGKLIAASLAALTPAERDERMQLMIAQGMTPQQRFRAALRLTSMALSIKRRQEADRHE